VERIVAAPALAAKVLRIANSAYYGQSGQVSTVDRAVAVLGLQALRGAALAACFDSVEGRSDEALRKLTVCFCRHSLATACAAKQLALTLAPHLVEEAFMAGLLHDVGLLFTWKLQREAAKFVSFLDAGSVERYVGRRHGECGRLLLEAWSMPKTLTQAVAEHDRIEVGPSVEATLSVLVALAEALAVQAGFGLPGETECQLPAEDHCFYYACTEAAAIFPASLNRLLAVLGG
jgi:HD-like signal output (HDOD) protein